MRIHCSRPVASLWRSAAHLAIHALLVLAVSLQLPLSASASDHADPLQLDVAESNLTGLFFFPVGDRMIAAINVRRGLSTPGPYNLSPFVFRLHFDLESGVSFDDAEDRARYGGTIVDPAGITATAEIEIRLNDDASLGDSQIRGLAAEGGIRIWSGVRDDPFIFPRFEGKNVISTVISLPREAFPPGQQVFVLWATVSRSRDGVQIDHVGRSNRTQLGRFDFLNTVPPREHVSEILAKLSQTSQVEEWLGRYRQLAPLANLYHYVLQLRPYDVFPDVLIYTSQQPAGFPNGRRLEDDVVGLTCAQGDCDLQELAFFEGKEWPRRTVNDKPFLSEFPFLAEPWPESSEPAPAMRSVWPIVTAVSLGLAGILALVFALGVRRGRARR